MKPCRRRWELIVFPKIWYLWINRPYGKFGSPFLRETWIGPFCLKVWADPRSVGSLSHPVRIVK